MTVMFYGIPQRALHLCIMQKQIRWPGNTINATYSWCMMGRLYVIPSIKYTTVFEYSDILYVFPWHSITDRCFFSFQVRMLSFSLSRVLLFLLVTSYVSTKKTKTSSSNQDVKNQTSEKRQYIGKWLLTAQLHCLDILV